MGYILMNSTDHLDQLNVLYKTLHANSIEEIINTEGKSTPLSKRKRMLTEDSRPSGDGFVPHRSYLYYIFVTGV